MQYNTFQYFWDGAEPNSGMARERYHVDGIYPENDMNALKHFYYLLGNKILGEYGFYDAFSEQSNWYPQRYLAIDQGPAVIMIENFRTGILWDLFMSCEEIQSGLKVLGFTTGK